MRFFLLFALCVLSCSKSSFHDKLVLPEGHQVLFLDSVHAVQAIVLDTTNHFFSTISKLDLAIQCGKSVNEDSIQLASAYQELLQKNVTGFSPENRVRLEAAIRKAYKLCGAVAPGIFPKTIRLIKYQGDNYGPGTWYTRENCIVVPVSMLEHWDEADAVRVFLHEVFHVFSRFNPGTRNLLYREIGFYPVPRNHLVIPSALRQRQLQNPDGLETYAIRLVNPDGTYTEALPLIYSKEATTAAAPKPFFEYMAFDLFPFRRELDDQLRVLADPTGLPLRELATDADFHRQIGDNTHYIIHPDEILADNFSLLVLEADKSGNSKLSESGKQLLQKLRNILSANVSKN